MQNILDELKKLGADIKASQYAEGQSEEYVTDVRTYINSLDFMRLGQAINRGQWQAGAMKAGKMSAKAKELGIVRFERPFTAIRQNINRRNGSEALQALSGIIAIRVKLIEVLREAKQIEC